MVVATRLHANPSGMVRREFGTVPPLKDLVFKTAVNNPNSFPLILEGFDKACGLRVTVDGGGIVPPKGRVEMTLTARTNTLAGPGGATFELTENKLGKRTVVPYVLSWLVAPHPSLSQGEIWFSGDDVSPKVLQLMNADSGDRVLSVHAPSCYSISVEKEGVTVTPSTKFEDLVPGTLEVALQTSVGPVNLSIPIDRVPIRSNAVSPGYIFLTPGETKLAQFDHGDETWKVEKQGPYATAEIRGNTITVKGGRAGDDHEAAIFFRSSKGQTAELHAFVEGSK